MSSSEKIRAHLFQRLRIAQQTPGGSMAQWSAHRRVLYYARSLTSSPGKLLCSSQSVLEDLAGNRPRSVSDDTKNRSRDVPAMRVQEGGSWRGYHRVESSRLPTVDCERTARRTANLGVVGESGAGAHVRGGLLFESECSHQLSFLTLPPHSATI